MSCYRSDNESVTRQSFMEKLLITRGIVASGATDDCAYFVLDNSFARFPTKIKCWTADVRPQTSASPSFAPEYVALPTRF